MNEETSMSRRVVVVGGGLAGFTSAVTAAQLGADVLLLEARETVGGRARTNVVDGFAFNQGPHALYAASCGMRILNGLGIHPRGRKPPTAGGYGRYRGELGLLPGTSAPALRSPLLGWRAKTQLARVLARPKKALATPTAGRSMRQWIDERVSDPGAVAALSGLARLTTYVGDLDDLAADAAVPQLVSGLTDSVFYLDGGWAQLVDALRDKAVAAGVKIDTDAKVESLSEIEDADAVILAVGDPAQTARIIGERSSVVQRWAADASPVVAASLDLGLSHLPVPDRRFCLGLDDPLYFSVHSASAALAPEGCELLHVMQLGDPTDDTRAALETFLDDVQPGWRACVLAERYGRRLVVSYDRPRPTRGIAGRPGPAILDCPGVFVAGDWVGDAGMLADASFASGDGAARAALMIG